MRNPEEIKKQIDDSRKSREWIDTRLDRIKKLNAPTRAIGQRALGFDDKGSKSNGLNDYQFHNHVLGNFRELDEAQLVELVKALFPRISDVVQAALALQERLPYQLGFARKAYRTRIQKDLLVVRKREVLASFVTALQGLDEDLPWIAAHAAYLEPPWGGASNAMGSLLAAALDAGGANAEQVDSILRESAAGTHETGTMGRHITSAFLCSDSPDGWRFVEGMLLAAQRQEGFRQSILESIDIALPDAFRHMLRVINDNNLIRFSSTVRAADVWLALRFDSQSARSIGDSLETLSRALER